MLAEMQSASGFRSAAQLLNVISASFLQENPSRDVTSELAAKKWDEMVGYMVSAVVLQAFAIELVLKALGGKCGIAAAKSHDLLKLFQGLPESEQVAANQTYLMLVSENPALSDTKRNLADLLKAHKNDFQEWRYQYEFRPTLISIGELDRAFCALQQRVETLGVAS